MKATSSKTTTTEDLEGGRKMNKNIFTQPKRASSSPRF